MDICVAGPGFVASRSVSKLSHDEGIEYFQRDHGLRHEHDFLDLLMTSKCQDRIDLCPCRKDLQYV